MKNKISKLNLISIFDFLGMIEVALSKIWGNQFAGKKRNIRREEIEVFVILLRLSNKLIPKRIGHWKLEIGPPNRIYIYSECVLKYTVHLRYVKSVQIRSFFWSVFSCIWTECRDLLLKSPYSVRIQENTDQKKLCI